MFISPEDVLPFATIDGDRLAAMIADAEAMAVLTAPCLVDLADPPASGETLAEAHLRLAKLDAVKAILRGALVRWHDAGSGAFSSSQRTAGPFTTTTSFDTRTTRKAMFWPSEIETLQGICSGPRQAFSVDTVAEFDAVHAAICSLNFGGTRCSCGASIAGFPLWPGVPPDDLAG